MSGHKRRKSIVLWICALAVAIVAVGIASSYRLTIGRYEIRMPKVRSGIRLLLLADLHSCYYGKNQNDLVRAIDAEHPDALMFCGDIADDDIPIDNVRALLEATADRYPCFYVTGNHEYWSGEVGKIKSVFREFGVAVLEGEYVPLVVCGVDDPESKKFKSQLVAAAEGTKTGFYTVLLSHRPELFLRYVEEGFDLVLSGHAHGGLWRIPGLLPGLAAPNQGFFPKYTSGKYSDGNTIMIVSRGLARESTRIPRFFNSTELVTIDLLPSE